MKKKTLIIALSIIILIAIIITISVTVLANKNKRDPKEIWKAYISKINNSNYEEAYDMLTQSSKESILKEDFIKRNKNIYEGIEMQNMQIEITDVSEEDDISKITYNLSMDTKAGKITFNNIVKLEKDKQNGYLIDWSSKLIYPQLENEDKIRVNTIQAERGKITDRNDIALAENGKISSIGIVPGKLGEDKEQALVQISDLLGIDIDTIKNELSASWVKDDSFVPIKKVSMSETELKQKLLQIPGIKISSVTARTYPLNEAAAHLIGYIQNINAEELEKNQNKGYNSNSLIGKTGLERKYEERLKGSDGIEIYIEDAEGDRKATIAKKEVINGENIKLTIDSNIQNKLYNELKNDEGFFVVMEPHTGEILALVSTPSYDPNKFILGISQDEWNEIINNEKKPMTARYLQSWCPGSTMKPVTGAIGLTTDSLSEEDTFTYSGLSWQKDKSWGDYTVTTLTGYSGAQNLRNAIIHSDNIYFAQATLQIGKENFQNGLNRIKFGENIDFELQLSKSQYSNQDNIETEVLLANSGYGQGQMLVNPIHMASIYSAFANEGNMIKPYLEQKDNKNVEYLVEGAFSEKAANIIEKDMIQVIENDEGTAKAMRVEGRTIAGKTGTAELKESKEDNKETLAWFNCYTADDKENQLLVIAMVENGRTAGGSSYLVRKIKTLF